MAPRVDCSHNKEEQIKIRHFGFWCCFQRFCILNVEDAVSISEHFRGSHSRHTNINIKMKALADEPGSWFDCI